MTAPQPWPTTRLCPATSNLPTRMLASTWQALCAAMQRREAVGSSRGKGGMAPEDFKAISAARFPCAMCQGRTLPPGLELITQQEAERMARTTKRGTCDLCGASSNVGTNHGSKVCTNCTHIQSALSKRPQSVANAIRAMGKTEEMLGHLIPAGGLAVKVTADLLQEISGIVGYDGEDPSELVAAVRLRARTCEDCGAADDTARRIKDVIGYTDEDADGLVEAVRALIVTPGAVPDCSACDAAKKAAADREDCADCTALRGDLLRACGLDMDEPQADVVWDTAVAGAIQEIADLTDRNIFLHDRRESLLESLTIARQEADHVRGKLREALEANDSMVHEISSVKNMVGIGESQLTKLRAELILAQQSHDEWEQRAVDAEINVETLESELRNREYAPAAPCASTTYLLDIALRALRGEGPDADQLATLLDAARRAA